MAKPIRDLLGNLQDLLHINKKYRVLVYISNGYNKAVAPKALFNHLRHIHRTNLKLCY
jgi:hypothetical protein